jgi:FkbM family methyltransferase
MEHKVRSLTINIIRFTLIKLLSQDQLKDLILEVAERSGINLLILAYGEIGILKYWSDEVTGESYLISNVLKTHLKTNKLVFFDVGANVGEYTKKLRDNYPDANIYAFEPNPDAFSLLVERVDDEKIKCFPNALSSCRSIKKIYTDSSLSTSVHTSLYKNVFLELHKKKDIVEKEIVALTLDEFCVENEIDEIDFIKIDTEGHELEVLLGAQDLIKSGRIKLIQFEFNEMNIISRVFLKDFYKILHDYSIYRLDSKRLIPIFEYSSSNEIFKFQNLVAINKKMK